MAVSIDVNTLYTIPDICQMFDLSRETLERAMKSPVCRLEAAKIGSTVYVRGDHLLRYFASLIPDDPTALGDDAATAAGAAAAAPHAEEEPLTPGIIKSGEFAVDSGPMPKVMRGQTTGSLKRLSSPPPPAPPPARSTPPAGPAARTTPPTAPNGERHEAIPNASAGTGGGTKGPQFARKTPSGYDIEALVREAEELGRQRGEMPDEDLDEPKKPDPRDKKAPNIDKWL